MCMLKVKKCMYFLNVSHVGFYGAKMANFREVNTALHDLFFKSSM